VLTATVTSWLKITPQVCNYFALLLDFSLISSESKLPLATTTSVRSRRKTIYSSSAIAQKKIGMWHCSAVCGISFSSAFVCFTGIGFANIKMVYFVLIGC